MSNEGFPNSTEQSQEGQSGVRITSFEDYLESVKGNAIRPLKTHLERVEAAEDRYKTNKAIDGKIQNDQGSKELEELLTNGLVEDLGYYDLNDKTGLEQIILPSILNEQSVQQFLVYDNEGEIIGHHYYRDRDNLTENEQNLKGLIDKKYKDLNTQVFYLREQEKEWKFQQSVIEGTMIYLGKLTFDEYADMIKRGLQAVETIPVFDDNYKAVSGLQKVYAYLTK